MTMPPRERFKLEQEYEAYKGTLSWDEWLEKRLESQQSYAVYRENGGTLDLDVWLAAGEPTATDERASNAWLDSLAAYLQSQIDSKAMSFDEAVLIEKDMFSRLFGQGKYEGERKSVIELPSWLRTDVEDYRKSLPIQEQQRLDEEAALKQQQAQDIATQKMQLPLGAGGTIPQQINAGQLAIRNLQIQSEAAPAHLKGVINQQIADLQRGIEQLWETETAMGRARQEALEPSATEDQWPGSSAIKFAEKYNTTPEAAMKTAQRYNLDRESNVGEESGEFTGLTVEEQADLRAVGDEETQRSSDVASAREKPVKPFEVPTFGELDTTGSPSWKSWFAQRYPTIVSRFKGGEGGERTETGWASFLKTERERIQAEFTKQTPYSRGERPSAFAPKIKTVAW